MTVEQYRQIIQQPKVDSQKFHHQFLRHAQVMLSLGVMAHLKYCHLFEQVVEESIMSIEEAIIENL